MPVLEEHPELTKLLGEKARARVLDRYTLQNNISQLEILYQEAIKSYQESLMNRN